MWTWDYLSPLGLSVSMLGKRAPEGKRIAMELYTILKLSLDIDELMTSNTFLVI